MLSQNMTVFLSKRLGRHANRMRSQCLMRKMGLVGLVSGPLTSRRQPSHKVYPYLLNDVIVEQPGRGVLFGGTGCGVRGGTAGDIQHRPGGSVHEPPLHGTAAFPRRVDQHGWERSGVGQRVDRAIVAHGEVRRHLHEGLRNGSRLLDSATVLL